MDDLQFRRSLYADPNSKDEALNNAKNDNNERKKFANDIDALEQKIAQALAVPVPDDLCDKLILRQTMASHQQTKRKSRYYLAIAASIAMVFGVLFNFLQFSSAYSGLGDYALAHVHHEEADLNRLNSVGKTSVSLTTLNNKMSAFNGTFSKVTDNLLAADYCRFDGVKSLHLVFQSQNSPVNVFIVPEREEVSFTAEFYNSRYQGRSAKFGQQQVIVVGDKSETIEHWQKNIIENIQWSA